jgi:hypothetical protein
MTDVASIITDACDILEHYLKATKPPFRRAIPLQTGGYKYPEDTIQADCGAFAGVFTCLWRAIEDKQTFKKHYVEKPLAFNELIQTH